MKQYKIYVMGLSVIKFIGEYLRELEKPNWHYYRTSSGHVLHFRKEHMLYVVEGEVTNEDTEA
jgi:hypothetical protein